MRRHRSFAGLLPEAAGGKNMDRPAAASGQGLAIGADVGIVGTGGGVDPLAHRAILIEGALTVKATCFTASGLTVAVGALVRVITLIGVEPEAVDAISGHFATSRRFAKL